ncbi:MAG: nicotinate-nucleotide--dimethylbenzimidazole phosphoribosyltransferase, partial [Blautia massiliensis (ex Durand et al. 2017)]
MSEEERLKERLAAIRPASEQAREQARQHWAACAKPLGSLGLLEDALTGMAALTGDARLQLTPRAVLVLCADNGVVAQGVSQSGSEVTGIVARMLAQGKSNVCRMAALADCRVLPVDMGIRDFAPFPGVIDRRIGYSTQDITEGPAMPREAACRAILAGVELVREQQAQGVRLLATGEMGIGNTTTAAAVACALLGR